jgi:hypothetical protein
MKDGRNRVCKPKLVLTTVKASNLGPHGKFGHFLAGPVTSLDGLCANNDQNRILKSYVFLQILSTIFFVGRIWMIANSYEKSPKYT